ncbi:MAG: hypothetical protein QME87_10275 [Bacillota bacterium]|nr:hypothetical protein [Bacillota bacterium]
MAVVMRDRHGRWLKGSTPNPGGRPKEIAEVRELARQHTEEAISVLVEIMLDPEAKHAARVAAANALLDRGWGRPQQALEVTQQDAGLRIVISEKVAAALEAGGSGSLPRNGERTFAED